MRRDQYDRLLLMATSDPKWDLSPNDVAAIRAIVDEHTRMRDMLLRLRDQFVPRCQDTMWTSEDTVAAIDEVLGQASPT